MPDRVPSRAVGALLALVLPPGVGHAYLGLTRRGALWLGVCSVLGLGVPASMGALGGALGDRAALFVVLAVMALPWIGPVVDVLLLRRERFGETRMTALVLFLAGGTIVALAARVATRVFLLEAFKVPSGAMMPTILVGDHLFVDKLAYRTRAPRLGEVMVFAFPEQPREDFIKRVIALPGYQLDVKNGHPSLNGWPVPYCKVGTWSYADSDPGGHHEGELDVEFLGDQSYLTFYDTAAGVFPEVQGPYHAKPGEYWVMGDNRNNSHDSRMWFGATGGGVPRDLVRGHALFVWLSTGPSGVDGKRTGQSIEGPTLPKGAESLQPALDACMKTRPPPAQTTPPSPKP
jgi:signal peptidase I